MSSDMLQRVCNLSLWYLFGSATAITCKSQQNKLETISYLWNITMIILCSPQTGLCVTLNGIYILVCTMYKNINIPRRAYSIGSWFDTRSWHKSSSQHTLIIWFNNPPDLSFWVKSTYFTNTVRAYIYVHDASQKNPASLT